MTQRAAQATAPVYFVQQTLKGGVAFGYFAPLQGRRQCHSPQGGNGTVPGAGLQAFIDVRLKPDADSRSFLAWAQDNPAVRDAVHVTGPYDYLLNVRVPGMPALDALLHQLKTESGALQTQTRLALR
ncbi:Lrp/AsnC ligand binding domain-containing protein [Arthrobacter koreensis]|uniref:Lrp/AsnC ligand binding domain-containing protein n=1 Tax=Arthrobacter koreensis TaxID=199136 RepID=UPI0036DAB0FB